MELFGTADCVGRTFRMTINKNTQEFTVVGVYHKDLSPWQPCSLAMVKNRLDLFPTLW